MKTLFVLLPAGAVLAVLLSTAGQVQASGMAYASKIHGGTLACAGNHFSRVMSTEQHRTSYLFRNFSDHATITIERVQVFDANGDVLFEFPGNELPASVKTELGPHAATQINSADILVEELDQYDRPPQARVEWSYGYRQRDVALNGSTVRTVRATDTGEERSRASSECKLIGVRP